jgi:hypothetical protein
MRKRNRKAATQACFLAFLMLTLALTGCAGALGKETIIIPDDAEEEPAASGSHMFEIEALYRLPNGDRKYGGLFRWNVDGGLTSLTWGYKDGIALDEFAPPFEAATRIRDIEGYLLDIGNLSPDGRYLIGYSYDEEAGQESRLTLVTIESGEEKEIGALRSVLRVGSSSITWSDNGEAFAYFTLNDQGQLGIEAYDMASGTKRMYVMPEQNGATFYYSARLSNDGQSAIVIKEEKGMPVAFQLGKLADGKFVPQYEHTMHQNGSVDWIDRNRVAFTGTDGTLFAHDLRNDGYAVLLDQVSSFTLSPDRSYIAYSTPDAVVEVAKLQGNNLLYKTTVYRGIVADSLVWSPDGGSLLIQGRKPYDDPAVVPQAAAAESQPAQDFSFQQIVIDFRS